MPLRSNSGSVIRRKGELSLAEIDRKAVTDTSMIRWILRQDAASVFFVVIAVALLAWFVWTLL
jgi:hypothetical protein